MILESESLTKTLEQFIRCPTCNGPVDVVLKTVTLATKVTINCISPNCTFKHQDMPMGTTIHQNLDDNYERNTDYAVNVLFVLAFLSCGDGSTEAARVLGLLG